MGYRLLADLTAAVHLATIVFLIVGGPLALLRRRLLLPHVAVLAAVGAVNLTGSDCPLTVWEQQLQARGGQQPYSGGFIEHYLVEPVHPAGITPAVELLIYALALVPTVLAYGALLLRAPAAARRTPTG